MGRLLGSGAKAQASLGPPQVASAGRAWSARQSAGPLSSLRGDRAGGRLRRFEQLSPAPSAPAPIIYVARMCGIAGSTDDPRGEAVRRMCSTLRHRGPDDEGIHSDPATGVSIGARRLAVMDVEGGHQPLSNEDGSVWVAFNGEIYNHRKLRADLLDRGHRFQTHGDTEVLVPLHEEYGDELVHALEGMFAFAVWDAHTRRLLLARDRFGEKPLFLHEHAGELMFASELTSLVEIKPHLRELDPRAIDACFVSAYVPGPGPIVPGVRQPPPG